LIEAIETQLSRKFGAKGARVVDENLKVVKRGFDEVRSIAYEDFDEPVESKAKGVPNRRCRSCSATSPPASHPSATFTAFGNRPGLCMPAVMGNDNLADPFIGMSTIPAVTTLFRDMTSIRFQYPQWNAENCTACGSCYTACPDTAIPGLVSELSSIFDTVIRRLDKQGQAGRSTASRGPATGTALSRTAARSRGDGRHVRQLLDQAIAGHDPRLRLGRRSQRGALHRAVSRVHRMSGRFSPSHCRIPISPRRNSERPVTAAC
jgi:ferredoxin